MNTKTTVATITVNYGDTEITADINQYEHPNGDCKYMVSTDQYDGFTAMVYSAWYGHKPIKRTVDADMKWRARNALLEEIDNQGGLNYMTTCP